MELCIDAKNKIDNRFDVEELCSARKFWGLWYFFSDCPLATHDYERYLTPEAWDRFVKTIEPKFNLIKTVRNIYWDMWDSNDDDYTFTDEEQKLIKEYEDWYDETFDCSTTLGYDFDTGALISWYEHKEEIWEYLCDDNYDVIIVNSF